MLMRSMLRFTTHLYLVLTVLAGVPAGASRFVLCVAPIGHVAIEVGEGRCADYIPSASGASTGTRTVPDGCGDCVDVPMGSQVLSAARYATSAAGPERVASSPMLAGSHHAELLAVAYRPALMHGTQTHPSFPPSRSTILRN
jgi:hypothetical protein